ncbi:hypothetical protein [Sphingomonas sp. GB1N7]|uniref:hypothetical protein n=1 Tax=Parasphingomonas caseinilytica TaxID=3096158 RepID=UPI002FC5F317
MSGLECPVEHLDRLIVSIRETLAVADAGHQPLLGAILADCLEVAKAVRKSLPTKTA